MEQGILFENEDSSILLIDIPRSIEAAQFLSPCSCPDSGRSLRHLISSEPLARPYPSLEPKSVKAKAALKPPSLQDLLLRKHLEFALEEVREARDWKGEWYLPRIIDSAILKEEENEDLDGPRKKIKLEEGSSDMRMEKDDEDVDGPRKRIKLDYAKEEPKAEEDIKTSISKIPSYTFPLSSHAHSPILDDTAPSGLFYSNSSSVTQVIQLNSSQSTFSIPPQTTIVLGELMETSRSLSPYTDDPLLSSPTPRFDVILLDPPWPNRSARRSKTYSTNPQIRDLLSSIPVDSLLTDDGLVAVWITNRESFRDMVLGEGGLFEEWGVELYEEWCWLKVTSTGEPVYAIDGVWRKPYEILLVGRRRRHFTDGQGDEIVERDGEESVKRRVIMGVPDLHSRKPNLRYMFEKVMGRKSAEYQALEVFARNLTAGWWSWGNEVLKFQDEECWVDGSS